MEAAESMSIKPVVDCPVFTVLIKHRDIYLFSIVSDLEFGY